MVLTATSQQHFVTMTSKVNGKTGTLTSCRSETPENFTTIIEHIDYVAGANTHAKFYGNRPRGVRPTNSQNITSCDFVYLPFPSLSFPSLPFLPCPFFLSSHSAKTAGRVNIPYRSILHTTRFQPRMCLLGVKKFKFNI